MTDFGKDLKRLFKARDLILLAAAMEIVPELSVLGDSMRTAGRVLFCVLALAGSVLEILALRRLSPADERYRTAFRTSLAALVFCLGSAGLALVSPHAGIIAAILYKACEIWMDSRAVTATTCRLRQEGAGSEADFGRTCLGLIIAGYAVTGAFLLLTLFIPSLEGITALTLFFGAVGVAGDAMYDVFLGRAWGKL